MEKIYFPVSNFNLEASWNNATVSPFEDAYLRIWNAKKEKGIFRYKLNISKSRILEGKFNFFAQLNRDRAINRRLPEKMCSLKQEFDETSFNFTKISKDEFMFLVVTNKNGCEQEIAENYIAINVSPLEYGHSLLLPSLYNCLPQLLTLNSIEFAINTLLSCHNPAFRIGFNGLLAYASVNHLHLHAYYLNQPMLLETIDVVHLSGNCYILENYPARGYAFQISSLSDIDQITRDVYCLTKMFVNCEIAHNMFLTRGTSFSHKQSSSNIERDSIRIYLWARKKSPALKITDDLNPAMCELFGHILVKTEEFFNQLTEEKVCNMLHDLTDNAFNDSIDKVRILFAADG